MKNLLLLLCLLVPLAGNSQSTASKNIHTFEIEAPQLDTIRKIWVYLPEGYAGSKKRYPVIYMHDAQNLFDVETSFVGEWKIDEFLDSRPNADVIIVGIEHGNEKRIAELTPFANEKYGGGEADKYLEFLRITLKPHIDASYRTLTDLKNTSIMGSSLGGLVSFYALFKYPDTFGQAGVFSPSFWFSQEIFTFVKNAEIDPEKRIYFLVGTGEGEEMVPDLHKMTGLLLEKGFPKENFSVNIIEGGGHNEAFWSENFPTAFDWLFYRKNEK